MKRTRCVRCLQVAEVRRKFGGRDFCEECRAAYLKQIGICPKCERVRAPGLRKPCICEAERAKGVKVRRVSPASQVETVRRVFGKRLPGVKL